MARLVAGAAGNTHMAAAASTSTRPIAARCPAAARQRTRRRGNGRAAAAAAQQQQLPGGSSSAQAVVTPPPLRPPQLIHTTAYLQQTQQMVLPQLPDDDADARGQEQQLDLNSNALAWALKKVDDQLDLVEQQPSEIHQALFRFSNGPVGQATSKGVQAAAKLTMSATIEAAKAAAPVGKWALQQGFKAAVGLVGAAMEQERQQKQQQKQQQQRAKSPAGSGRGGKSGTLKIRKGGR